MRHYAAYGACLASEVAFPELTPIAPTGPRWRFTVVPSLPAMRDVTPLGAEPIYDDVDARLVSHRDGHRITIADTGVFDIARDGRELQWEERRESWPDFVRAHCLGRVIATSMYLGGWLPLHASAVGTREGAIAFLAPKGFGKSSLALALTGAGARLLTDDTLPLEITVSGECIASPGIHSLRVSDEALSALGVAATGDVTRERKRALAPLAPAQLASDPVPLRAIYLLDPMMPGAGAPVSRVRLPETLAAVGIVAHVKSGRMLGAAAAPALLERAARVVARVPVHRLEVTRDLALLASVARDVLDWHGAA